MIVGKQRDFGVAFEDIVSCDFSRLMRVSNRQALEFREARKTDDRLAQFIEGRMGITNRFRVPDGMDALDLARNALQRLVDRNPKIVKEAEFIILAGISNPMPTTCTSAMLAGDFQFTNASCWDLKSGCSTGVLALLQAVDWFAQGATKGVIICAETLSRFFGPDTADMSVSIGDGAVAMIVSKSAEWKILSTLHGTDPEFFRSLYVPGRYPVAITSYDENSYKFKTDEKTAMGERTEYHWLHSLQELINNAGLNGSHVDYYFAHQIDGKKNLEFALKCGIPDAAIHLNFSEFGNMGCPTVFVNFEQSRCHDTFVKGDRMIFHAVGGGISWAGLLQEKLL